MTVREKCFQYRGFVFDRFRHLAGDITANATWELIAMGNMNAAAKMKSTARSEEDRNFSWVDTGVITLNKRNKC